jgi:hypothetical protein
VSKLRDDGLSLLCAGEFELELCSVLLEFWDSPVLELGCRMGMEVVGVYARV